MAPGRATFNGEWKASLQDRRPCQSPTWKRVKGGGPPVTRAWPYPGPPCPRSLLGWLFYCGALAKPIDTSQVCFQRTNFIFFSLSGVVLNEQCAKEQWLEKVINNYLLLVVCGFMVLVGCAG